MQPQFGNLYVIKSKKILIFLTNGFNRRQRYIKYLKFTVMELAGENNVYTKWWLKTKLKVKDGVLFMFTEASGKPDVVCFKDMTKFIVNDKWFSEKTIF